MKRSYEDSDYEEEEGYNGEKWAFSVIIQTRSVNIIYYLSWFWC